MLPRHDVREVWLTLAASRLGLCDRTELDRRYAEPTVNTSSIMVLQELIGPV
jgi:hypothetical protein